MQKVETINALSEVQNRLRGNMTDSDNAGDAYHENIKAEEIKKALQLKTKWREMAAESLGGLRALDNYRLDRLTKTPQNEAAINASATFNPIQTNLYLYGPVGSGKSHIAVSGVYQWFDVECKDFDSTNEAIARSVQTVKPATLGREIRAASSATQEAEIIETLQESKVLIIDDMGVEKDSEFMVNILYEIIDWRYMNRPGGLIVTSNLSLDALSRKLGDDRIPSRLRQMCKGFDLKGEKDYRIPVREK